MPRPHKWRMVDHIPECDHFRPAGERGGHAGHAEEVGLFWEELEAIRLKDLEGLDQSQAAERMEVSRPTFQRILRAARYKVAQALINGLVLHVDGGHYRLASGNLRCRQCGHKWRGHPQHHERDVSAPMCPLCGSTDVAIRHRQSERHSR